MGYQSLCVRILPSIVLVMLAACTSVRPLPKLARQYQLPECLPKKKVGLVEIYVCDSLVHIPARTEIRTRTKLRCIPFLPMYFIWDEKRTLSVIFGRDKMQPSLNGCLASSFADALHRAGLDTSLGVGRFDLLVDSVDLRMAFSKRDAWGMAGLFAADIGGKQSQVGPATYDLTVHYRFTLATSGSVYEGAKSQRDSIYKKPDIQYIRNQPNFLKNYLSRVGKGYSVGIDSLASSLVADIRRQVKR